jgi:sugar/nucleoside kinase (ribokinase family)
MTQVAVIGSATRDRVVDGEVTRLKWGGAAVYSGLTLSRLGISTTVVTNIAGRDSALMDLLSMAGISVEAGDSDATTEFVNHVNGDERRQELLSCAAPIAESQVAEIAAKVDHVYLGPLHPLDIKPKAIKELRSVDRVSVDIQGYTRRVEGIEVHTEVSEHLRPVLEQVDMVKASRDETAAVKSFYGQETGTTMQECGVEQWLMTDGPRGGWLLSSSGVRHDFRAVPASEIADPTGAGDVFFAAYLTYHLYQGANIDQALQRASVLTARHVEGRFITADEIACEEDGQ